MIPLEHQAALHSIYAFHPYGALHMVPSYISIARGTKMETLSWQFPMRGFSEGGWETTRSIKWC
jgi:hypothetical protein